jgi:hypothetical protein
MPEDGSSLSWSRPSETLLSVDSPTALIFPVIFAIFCRDLTTLTLDDLHAKVDRFQSFTPKSSMLKTAAGSSRLIFTSVRLCLNIVLPPL